MNITVTLRFFLILIPIGVASCTSANVREMSDPEFRKVSIDTTAATESVLWTGDIEWIPFSLTREIDVSPERRAYPDDPSREKVKAREFTRRISLSLEGTTITATAEDYNTTIYEIIKGVTVLDKDDHVMKGDIIGVVKEPVRFTFSRIDHGVRGSLTVGGSVYPIISALDEQAQTSWKLDFVGAYSITDADGNVLATVHPASDSSAMMAEYFQSESSRAYSALYLRKTLDEPTVRMITALALLTLSLGR